MAFFVELEIERGKIRAQVLRDGDLANFLRICRPEVFNVEPVSINVDFGVLREDA